MKSSIEELLCVYFLGSRNTHRCNDDALWRNCASKIEVLLKS